VAPCIIFASTPTTGAGGIESSRTCSSAIARRSCRTRAWSARCCSCSVTEIGPSARARCARAASRKQRRWCAASGVVVVKTMKRCTKGEEEEEAAIITEPRQKSAARAREGGQVSKARRIACVYDREGC